MCHGTEFVRYGYRMTPLRPQYSRVIYLIDGSSPISAKTRMRDAGVVRLCIVAKTDNLVCRVMI